MHGDIFAPEWSPEDIDGVLATVALSAVKGHRFRTATAHVERMRLILNAMHMAFIAMSRRIRENADAVSAGREPQPMESVDDWPNLAGAVGHPRFELGETFLPHLELGVTGDAVWLMEWPAYLRDTPAGARFVDLGRIGAAVDLAPMFAVRRSGVIKKKAGEDFVKMHVDRPVVDFVTADAPPDVEADLRQQCEVAGAAYHPKPTARRAAA